VSSPAGFAAEPDRPKVFLFSEFGMASTDTIILLVVDYHAAIEGGGKTTVPALLSYAPAAIATDARRQNCR